MNDTTAINTQKSTVKLAKMGMLVAISIVLVAIIHFPIFPAVAFLEYDPADIPILIGTFAFGPVAGLLLTIVINGLFIYLVAGRFIGVLGASILGCFLLAARSHRGR